MGLEAIDVIDRKIIDQLRVDGRRSLSEIGRYVGLSEASVRNRYKRLLALGVVQVVGMPNSQRLGQTEVHVFLQVRGTDLETVAATLSAFDEVKFVAACVGRFDLSVDVRCSTAAEMATFLSQTLRRVPGVERVEVETVLEVVKDEYVWAGFRDPVRRGTRPHPSTGQVG